MPEAFGGRPARIRDTHTEVLLTAAQRAEVWYLPVQTDQLKQAFYNACCFVAIDQECCPGVPVVFLVPKARAT